MLEGGIENRGALLEHLCWSWDASLAVSWTPWGVLGHGGVSGAIQRKTDEKQRLWFRKWYLELLMIPVLGSISLLILEHLGSILVPCWLHFSFLGCLGSFLGCFGCVYGRLGGVLSACWGQLGRVWARLGGVLARSWSIYAASCDASLAVSGMLRGVLGRLGNDPKKNLRKGQVCSQQLGLGTCEILIILLRKSYFFISCSFIVRPVLGSISVLILVQFDYIFRHVGSTGASWGGLGGVLGCLGGVLAASWAVYGSTLAPKNHPLPSKAPKNHPLLGNQAFRCTLAGLIGYQV